ncbi:MarR family winged helix-turn-helix transcriptional regulator [Streptomyces sp. LaPpAH-108]|uniref:MarR family winged helix-turn-helix transcriptional regulator n=1 Tax=Streptomyces sp. LaPpAH-108 TaxID=1155714 RepID=UPI00036CF1E1|nr:MarR family transcriptional regulator [Streptomyces sp. LaPpAH-108]
MAAVTAQDSVDEHLDRWLKVLPSLDPVVEGVVKRMWVLVRHLGAVKEESLAAHGLQSFEYLTLHALAGRAGSASPTELAGDLKLSPSAMTGRLDGLERRGFVRRRPSSVDRRKLDIELTDEGRAAWRSALETQGAEEHRILSGLSPAERDQLTDLLRRVLIEAEHRDPH